MSADEDSDDKPHEASQRRLDEARKRGDLPRSADLSTAAAYGGFLLALAIFGPGMVETFGATLTTMLAQSDRLGLIGAAQAPVLGLMGQIGLAVLPLIGLPAALVLAGLIAERSLVFAPSKLAPKLSRISPLATAKQKFGKAGLFDFAKSLAKMIAVGAVVVWYLSGNAGQILTAMTMGERQSAALMAASVGVCLVPVTAISLAFGGVDYLVQRLRHGQKLRMSHQELREETKDSEGDPHVKGQRRQRGQEIALNRMLADVAKADVVIVNPTHYAVALKWKRGDRRPPICLAKGVDEIAARIRERAALAGVPLHRDPPTARALHATVDLGQPIRPEHYKSVAAAIRFAEAMRRKRGRR